MANTKERYQVIGNSVEIRNFVRKSDAEAYMVECRAKGQKPQLWDMWDNPLSRMFSGL